MIFLVNIKGFLPSYDLLQKGLFHVAEVGGECSTHVHLHVHLPGSQRGPLQRSHQQLHPLLVAGRRPAGHLVFSRATDGCHQLQHDDHGTGEGVLMAGRLEAAEPGGVTGFSPGCWAVGGTIVAPNCHISQNMGWRNICEYQTSTNVPYVTAIIRALVKTWVASRLKLPRSEVGGVAWRPTNWAMELTSGPFFQTMKYLTPSPVACPCHYRVTCILTDFEVVSMSTSCVFLACRVDSRHSLVRDQFRSRWLTRGRCPHDVTDLLMVTMDQRSCAVEGCKSVICLQAFVFADLLDVSSDGGGVMPAPECRTGRDDGLHQVIGLFCGGFSGGGAMPRDSCQGWSFPSSLVLPRMLTMNAC